MLEEPAAPIFSQWVKNEMVKIVQKSVASLALGFSEWDFFLLRKFKNQLPFDHFLQKLHFRCL